MKTDINKLTEKLKITQLEAQIELYKPMVSSLQNLPALCENIKQIKEILDKLENETDEQKIVINDLKQALCLTEFALNDSIKDIKKIEEKVKEYQILMDTVKGYGWKILSRLFPTIVVVVGMVFAGWEFLKDRF
jgi:exoribonuclease R